MLGGGRTLCSAANVEVPAEAHARPNAPLRASYACCTPGAGVVEPAPDKVVATPRSAPGTSGAAAGCPNVGTGLEGDAVNEHLAERWAKAATAASSMVLSIVPGGLVATEEEAVGEQVAPITGDPSLSTAEEMAARGDHVSSLTQPAGPLPFSISCLEAESISGPLGSSYPAAGVGADRLPGGNITGWVSSNRDLRHSDSSSNPVRVWTSCRNSLVPQKGQGICSFSLAGTWCAARAAHLFRRKASKHLGQKLWWHGRVKMASPAPASRPHIRQDTNGGVPACSFSLLTSKALSV